MSRRVKFTPADDEFLLKLVETYGCQSWNVIAEHFHDRSARQCRDRWKHYLCPTTNTDQWTPEEDALLVQKVREFGKKWSQIAPFFAGRTPTSIRNRCCKLSRQKHADPLLKMILSGAEYPGPSAYPPIVSSPPAPRHEKLPSIESLLTLVNEKHMDFLSLEIDSLCKPIYSA